MCKCDESLCVFTSVSSCMRTQGSLQCVGIGRKRREQSTGQGLGARDQNSRTELEGGQEFSIQAWPMQS
jgi:hypothetical protein